MSIWECAVIAVGLSMDAFAVALCKGLAMRRIDWRQASLIALFFGGFQALMPLLGWLLGRQFEQYITEFDHWIAFGLLLVIGGKMIWDALTEGEEKQDCEPRVRVRELFVLAVATSIDALAVGVTFGLMDVQIIPAISLIGGITFALSLGGVALGNRFGARFKGKAALAGGVVLILIGTKILLEHLGILVL